MTRRQTPGDPIPQTAISYSLFSIHTRGFDFLKFTIRGII